MPTKTITVCSTCGKKTCDGALWKWVQVTEAGVLKVLRPEVMAERQRDCSLSFGQQHMKSLVGRPVGHQVDLAFNNWNPPAILTVEKVEA